MIVGSGATTLKILSAEGGRTLMLEKQRSIFLGLPKTLPNKVT